MATIARMIVGMGLDDGEFNRGISRVVGQINTFGATLGAAAGLGGAAALATGMLSAVNAAREFGTEMARVNTVLADASQLPALTRSVRALAEEFGAAPQAQAAALYEILSAGASSAAQATEILTAANKLAIGGVTDVKTAADGLTSVLASYGKAAGSATVVSDKFFIAAAAGKTTIEELSSQLGFVAPIASQMGVSLDELLAGIGALTKQGISTRTSVQGLRQVMASVAKPASEAAKRSQELGLSFTSASLASKGLSGFLADVQQKTRGNVDDLALLFGGVEALLPVIALTGNAAGDFATTLTAMGTAAGATKTAVDKMAASPGFQIDQAISRIKVAALDLGDRLLRGSVPALKAFSDNLGLTIEVLTAFAKAAGVAGALGAIVAYGPAVLGAVRAFALLVPAVNSAASAYALLNIATLGVVGPLGLAAAGIVALTALFFAYDRAVAASDAAVKAYTASLGGLNVAQLRVQQSQLADDAARVARDLAAANKAVRAAQYDGPAQLGRASSEAAALKQEYDRLQVSITAVGDAMRAQIPIEDAAAAAAGRTAAATKVVADQEARRAALAASQAAAAAALEAVEERVRRLTTAYDQSAVTGQTIVGLSESLVGVYDRVTTALAAQADQTSATAGRYRALQVELLKTKAIQNELLADRVRAGENVIRADEFKVAPVRVPAQRTQDTISGPGTVGGAIAGIGVFTTELQALVTTLSAAKVAADAAAVATTKVSLIGRATDLVNAGLTKFGTSLDTVGSTIASTFKSAGASVLGALNPLSILGTIFDQVARNLAPLFTALEPPLRLLAQVVNDALTPVFEAFQPVLEALVPLIRGIFQVFSPILSALAPLFQAFIPILELLFPVVKLIGIAFTFVAEIAFRVASAFQRAVGNIIIGFGKIVETIARAVDKLPGVSARSAIRFAERIQNAGNSVLQSATEMSRAADAMKRARKEIADLELDRTATAMDRLGDTADNVAAALLNVPAGFKIALARFDATAVDTARSGAQGGARSATAASAAAGAQVSNTYGDIHVTLPAGSTREQVDAFVRALQQRAYEQYGDASRTSAVLSGGRA